MKTNPLLATDFYKTGHRLQYPEGTTRIYSNLTARSNKNSNLPDGEDRVVMFGLQFVLFEVFNTIWDDFFRSTGTDAINEYKAVMEQAGFPNPDVSHFWALHKLGYLPIEIRAFEEGTRVPVGTPLLTMHNTHQDFPWLVNFLESVLTTYMWKSITSATTADWYKRTLLAACEATGGSPVDVDFQGHDFSFRGMSGAEDGAISGAAHLLSFFGTDTLTAIPFLNDYYAAPMNSSLIGTSIAATEHSVMCMGTKQGELETYRRLIEDVYPSGLVSIVSDTWDYFNVLTNFLPKLKDKIIARDGKVVIRPDSGDPVAIVCGEDYNTYDTIEEAMDDEGWNMRKWADKACEGSYCMGADEYEKIVCVGDKFFKVFSAFEYNRHDKEYYYVDYGPINRYEDFEPTPEFKGTLQLLWETFGGTVNEKGFKVLDEHIGTIFGDSLSPERLVKILALMTKKGFCTTNVAFGIGASTYQATNRDTWGFAFKATHGEVKGVGRNIFKEPKTDNGLKKSLCGLLRVDKTEDGEYVTRQKVSFADSEGGELVPVYRNGVLLRPQTLEDVREVLRNQG